MVICMHIELTKYIEFDNDLHNISLDHWPTWPNIRESQGNTPALAIVVHVNKMQRP